MPSTKNSVTPRALKGTQDLLPEVMIPRLRALRAIEDVFLLHGFSPIETPVLEHLDVLLGAGGEETNKELFRMESPEGDPIAMRFDLTVPFARVLAQYPDRVKAPFRRYAIGPVFRADKPGPGRFRQFTQCDADIAGTKGVVADAEIIGVMCRIMQALGVPRYQVLINNRRLIDALLEGLGIASPARQKHVLRIIDKLAKVGLELVRLELGPGRVDESGDPIPGAELDAEVIDRLLAFIGTQANTRAGILDALATALPESSLAEEALSEMRELDAYLEALGVGEEEAVFAPSLARGLDYYTGPVFEMVLPDAPQFGSVMGGGRYDGLVERFLDRPIPATGMAVGLDRLLAALEQLGLAETASTAAQVLVCTMGKVPFDAALRVASNLRKAGLRTEIYAAPKKRMKLGNQLSHADHYGIPVAVILGETEYEQGQAAVKDLVAGKEQREGIDDRDAYREAGTAGQTIVELEQIADAVKALLP